MRLKRKTKMLFQKKKKNTSRRFYFNQNKSLTNKNHNRKEAQLKAFPTKILQHVLNTQVF